MRIVVCIKQVPSTNKVQVHPETNTIIRDGRLSVTNPFDTYAIEEALRIKETVGGEVVALSMGIPDTERLLRDAESRGVDRAILLTDKKFAGADTLATSYTLALGIRELWPVNLIICGKMAVDGDTAQIGPELAEQMGIPHVTEVSKIYSITEETIECKKETDFGYQRLRIKLPALVTVVKDINMPRMPSIKGVLSSRKPSFVRKGAEELNADFSKIGLDGSPTQVVKTFIPDRRSQAVEIKGEEKDQVKEIMKILEEAVKDGGVDS